MKTKQKWTQKENRSQKRERERNTNIIRGSKNNRVKKKGGGGGGGRGGEEKGKGKILMKMYDFNYIVCGNTYSVVLINTVDIAARGKSWLNAVVPG